jgi:CHAT domain-containing protein
MIRNAIVSLLLVSLILPGASSAAQSAEAAAPDPEQQELISQSDRLYKQAQALLAAGRPDLAIAAGERLLALDEQIHGSVHEVVIDTLQWLAEIQEYREDFAAAETLRNRILRIAGELYREQPWNITDARLALEHTRKLSQLTAADRQRLNEALEQNAQVGRLYREGKYAEASALAEEVLRVRTELLGTRHPDTATSLNSLARLYELQDDYAKAEPLYVRSLEIREEVLGPQHPVTAASLHNLAALYNSQADYAKAEPLCLRSLEIREKVLGPKHPDTAKSLNELAVLYRAQGDYAKAEPLYVRSLEIQEKVLGPQHRETATSLNNLAALYAAQGDYAKAEPLYVRSLEIWEKVLGPQHPDTATSLNHLAVLYESQGDYAKAKALHIRSLEIREKVLGPQHPDTATSLNSLAFLYHLQADYAKAESLCLRGLEIREKVLGPQHPDTAGSLSNLAGLYFKQGDYARAEPLCCRALDIRLAALELAASIQSERQQLAMLASNRWSLDQYLAMAVESGTYAESAYSHLLAWKGSVLARQQAQRALAAQPELRPLAEELRTTTRELALRAFAVPTPQNQQAWQTQVARLSALRERLEGELSGKSAAYRAARQPPTLDDLRAVLPQDAVLVDLLEYDHGRLDPDRPGRLIHERRLLAFVVGKHDSIELVDLGDVESVSAAIDVWRAGFGRRGESAEAGQMLRSVVWEPIERVLVERNSSRSNNPESSGMNSALRLVLISPDGVLGRLPLAGLPGREPGTYLLEDWPLAVISSAQSLPLLLQGEDGRRPEGNLLVLGNVDYDRRSDAPAAKPKREFLASHGPSRAPRNEDGTSFGPLDGTRGELASIEKMYRDRFGEAGLKTLDAARATTDALRREAPRHLYLHLATHGFFAAPRFRSALERSGYEQRPGGEEFVTRQTVSGYHPGLLSGLALAGANRPEAGDDGILTAEEVATMDLAGVHLAVLSACETGLGQTAGGEGLLGLQRSFQTAGARTVIASLWKVDDIATRDLMERFYDNHWNKEMGKLAALREAQLWMLRQRGTRGLKPLDDTSHAPADPHLSPYYWAAFVLSGDWR